MENIKDKKRKLTDDERAKVTYVLDHFIKTYLIEEPEDLDYITEFDILMKKKKEYFKLRFLKDEIPSEINSLIERCDEYMEEEKNPNNKSFGAAFGFIMQYDMWINKCPFWPTNNPELWKRWDKLKKIKVRKRDN